MSQIGATRMRLAARLAPLAVLLGGAAVACYLRTEPAGWLVPARAWSPPSAAHLLGCGEAGVDMLALLSAGILRAAALAVTVALCAGAIGLPLGAYAGLRGGLVRDFVQRTGDLLQALPSFFLALVVMASVRHPGREHLALLFVATSWPAFARVALSEAAVLRQAGFVQAAYALGRAPLAVVRHHILPNLLPLGLVQLGATAAAVVLSETALGFVGLGPRDGVALGAAMEQGVVAMQRAPHVLLGAGATVFLLNRALLAAAKAGS
jgi:peptide/nickel transport system permease protein